MVAAGGFFGELCLFREICKYRHDTATAKEVKVGDGVSCFMLTSEAVADLWELCPQFCSTIQQLCLLRTHYHGVNNATFDKLLNAGHKEGRELEKTVRSHKHQLLEVLESQLSQMAICVAASSPISRKSPPASSSSVAALKAVKHDDHHPHLARTSTNIFSKHINMKALAGPEQVFVRACVRACVRAFRAEALRLPLSL